MIDYENDESSVSCTMRRINGLFEKHMGDLDDECIDKARTMSVAIRNPNLIKEFTLDGNEEPPVFCMPSEDIMIATWLYRASFITKSMIYRVVSGSRYKANNIDEDEFKEFCDIKEVPFLGDKRIKNLVKLKRDNQEYIENLYDEKFRKIFSLIDSRYFQIHSGIAPT